MAARKPTLDGCLAKLEVLGRFPEAGWATRSLSDDEPFVTTEMLTAEWPSLA
jgi:hypothetical protein